MIQWAIYVLFCLFVAWFCCWFAHVPGSDHVSGDWRRWGFDGDPLAPEPKPDGELVGK
jgi:hypothetical protein